METVGKRLQVVVLMGGSSAEREISLSTGRQILNALCEEKYIVSALDPSNVFELAAPEKSPDVALIALHGRGGEDGSIQGALELLGIPYTGSGILASAAAMNKAVSKRLFREAGIPIIKGMEIGCADAEDLQALLARVEAEIGAFPVFVKPNCEGSAFGAALVKTAADLPAALEHAFHYDDIVILEEYIRGAELTVGVLEDPETGEPFALPVIEIVPRAEYYDYESKYEEGGSEHIIPARIAERLLRRCEEIAVRCHRTLGCAGMSRTDILLRGEEISVLEVNTIPGMTPTSLLPQAAEKAGIPFAMLLDRMIQCALRDTQPR